MALLSLDKIGFVSTEIFHYIHARTNVAGTNVDVTNDPRQLKTHADGLTIQPSKFGRVLTSNSGDMASYLLLNYRDPTKNKNFAKPVVDIAASSRSLTWQPSWG